MSTPEAHPTSLLLSYVKGELEDDEAQEIRDHLEGCRRCANEEGGIRMLVLDPDGELTDLERARLHHAVIEAAAEPRSAHPGPIGRRLAPYLGTAAMLALLAIGVIVFDLASNDQRDTTSGVEAESNTAAPAGGDGGPRRLNTESSDEVHDAASGGAAVGNSSAPTPHFDPAAGRMAPADLDRLGRSSEPFRNFAAAYGAEETPVLQSVVLSQLTGGLPASEADVVRACTRAVLRETDRALPVYAGYGALDGEEVLLVGFAWTPQSTGALDRFMVWAWPRGSCDSPLVYRFGWIDR